MSRKSPKEAKQATPVVSLNRESVEVDEPTAFSHSQGAFNIRQAAAYVGTKCAAVESVIRDGRLPGRRFGRNIIVLKSDLDAFLSALDIIPPHTPPSIITRRAERAQQRIAA